MGRACGCTASHAHVRAIARADDAAVAITCARGYIRMYIANAHVMYNRYVYIHRCKVRVCKWVRVCDLAYACIRVRSRAGADDALIRGVCASATRSLRTPSMEHTRVYYTAT